MPLLTWWLWQFSAADAPGWDRVTMGSMAAAVQRMTPRPWRAAVLVKAHAGARWMATFDDHPLAVTGPDKLAALRDACAAEGLAFGVWGEPRGVAPGGGDLAGQASAVAGYYCADVEPYSDFDIDPSAAYGDLFWQAFRDHGGVEAGVSLVPLPSGLDPFGSAGLRAWLKPVRYVEPQCYHRTQPLLHPDVALPFLRERIRAARIGAKRVVPLLERGDLATLLDPRRYRWGASVWRL